MSNSVNANQINSMAQEIANLLDAKEQSKGTQGDKQIEASIWNKFVGEGQDESKQVGNGNKSLIKERIPFANAVTSIASYIKNKGTAKVAEALKQLGIDWKPDADVNATSTTAQKETKKSDNNKLSLVNDKEKAEAKKEYEKLVKIATTVKASNGMTYKEANSLRSEIRRNTLGGQRTVVVDKNGKNPHFKATTDEEFISMLEDLINEPQNKNKAVDRQRLEQYKKACAARNELLKKYPNLKNLVELGAKSRGQLISNSLQDVLNYGGN